MIRSALVVLSVFCIATLLSELSALAFLWYRGQLTADVVSDVRSALSGQNQAQVDPVPDSEPVRPSADEVTRNRSMRILDLSTRESELAVMKAMVTQKTNEVMAQKRSFEAQKQDFQAQLKAMSEQMNAEATEQTRGVLQAMSTPDAVESLMQLPLHSAVTLLKGLPEKTIAKIIQEFASDPENPVRIERGHEIFEAIRRGEPNSSLVDAAVEQFGSPTKTALNSR
jgi:flagellar motility protein MotE (MotC chaperone)